MNNQSTVSDIFRRAMQMREANPTGSYTDLKDRLIGEYDGKPFPSSAYLTIPELDNVAPEEDWTAGLPVILRGIQNEQWSDIAHGILICLEQVENYPKQSGREDDPDKNWRNRHKGIAEAEEKNMEKWMPEDLMNIAQKNVRS